MRTNLAVVVTAGGRIARADFLSSSLPEASAAAEDYAGEGRHVLIKALLKTGRRALLEIVLDAVRATGLAERTVIVGSAELQHWLNPPHETLVPELSEAHENLIAGLEAVKEYPRALYLTSDLPFVTADAIKRFVDACPPDAQLCYAIARREAFDARFPDSPSTYARLRDGEFVAGCAMMVEPAALLARAEWIRQVAQRRKSLWRLALLAGWHVLWKYATRQLRVADVERRAEQLLGMRCRAVECDPELAYDIDTPQEYEYAWRFANDRAG
ncbi:MAG: NTP transferase domain-containing protein [Firmicutes bacterium]|nr:NTP transferase domain-containing protein [Bacillota bacterium]